MDHYSTLGVSKNATDDEIKKAYRQMTLKYHPDRNQDDPGAADQFKKIAAAYEVLSDSKKKAEYDGAAQKASHDWNYTFNDDFTPFQITLGTQSLEESQTNVLEPHRARPTWVQSILHTWTSI